LAAFIALVVLHAEPSSAAVDATLAGVYGPSVCPLVVQDQTCSLDQFVAGLAVASSNAGRGGAWCLFNPDSSTFQEGAAAVQALAQAHADPTANIIGFGARVYGGACSGPSGVLSDFQLTWTCYNGSLVMVPGQCPQNRCVRDAIKLQLPISGPSPAAHEYTPVCVSSCTYEIGSAQVMRDKETSAFFMVGIWSGTTASCAAETTPVASGAFQDPDGAPGAAGEPDTSLGPDGCKADDAPCHAQKERDAEAGVDAIVMDSSGRAQGVLGKFALAASLFDIFKPITGREEACKLAWATPATLTALLGDNIELDACEYLPKIDRIGGFLLYLVTFGTLVFIVRQPPAGAA
jgi:hypothetical protein